MKDERYFIRDDPTVQPFPGPTEQCNHDATKSVVDSSNGYFAFSTHFWVGRDGFPRLRGPDYIYATGKNHEDNRIGPKEIKGFCRKVNAGRYCWTPDDTFYADYKGEHHGPDNGGSA
ncbi:hypothetical protein EG328_010906 [Venturia inaequalis]|uniref:Uncharacterized protein n=1 Tax=Venturia inaequalis TaxID=5025 RepID=A0A8H3U6S4_VENIN|nr:hypothetical protein EG328_010906 [Venturia inaequalis]